jgi:hypothetical protein
MALISQDLRRKGRMSQTARRLAASKPKNSPGLTRAKTGGASPFQQQLTSTAPTTLPSRAGGSQFQQQLTSTAPALRPKGDWRISGPRQGLKAEADNMTAEFKYAGAQVSRDSVLGDFLNYMRSLLFDKPRTGGAVPPSPAEM